MLKKYLAVFTSRRIAVTLLLGFSSGLPLPLVTGTLDGWMTRAGVDLRTIGMFSLVGVPYSLKFLWAPLMDRFQLPFLGRRTGWILIAQIGLVAAIATMGISDPSNAPKLFAILALSVAFLSATQDIVVDAYRAEVLSQKEMGAGAAVAVMGARIALIVSGAVAFILSDHMPWGEVYVVIAGCMGVGILATLIAPVPERPMAAPRTLEDAFVQPLVTFFKRPGAFEILLFVVFYKLGDAVAGKMTTPFLIKMGFSGTDIGTVNKGFGMVMTIVGALFGGGAIARIGILRALWVFGILQALSNFVFIALAHSGKHYGLLLACIGIENITGGLGTAAFVAFLMSVCDRRFTATQYALLTSVMALTRTFAGPITGYLAVWLGWSGFFAVSALLAVPGLVILVAMKKHLVAVNEELPSVS